MRRPPVSNLEIFEVVFNVENALRELIVQLLESTAGSRWYKSRLPGDILEKYREAIQLERATKWTQLVPHHPIYYVDFADLRKIIERSDNWAEAFEGIFSRKDLVVSALSEMEFLRNKVAHNRKASEQDAELAKSIYAKLVASIGQPRFDEFVQKTSLGLDIGGWLQKLQQEMESTMQACTTTQAVTRSPIWDHVSHQWWFDETYLGHNLEAITGFFALAHQYQALPRERGTGHIIERWLASSAIDVQFENAKLEILELLSEWSNP